MYSACSGVHCEIPPDGADVLQMEVTKTAHDSDLGPHSVVVIKRDTQVADLLGWLDAVVTNGHRKNKTGIVRKPFLSFSLSILGFMHARISETHTSKRDTAVTEG